MHCIERLLPKMFMSTEKEIIEKFTHSYFKYGV